MRAAALLPLITLLLAGCAAPACGDVQVAHWIAAWSDDGLYDRLAPSERAGLRIEQRDAGGLPFHNQAVEARWGDVRLHLLRYTGLTRTEDPRERFEFDERGNSSGLLAASRPPDEARRLFLDFARNLSRASEESLASAADTFMASQQLGAVSFAGGERRDFMLYAAPIPAPYRVEVVFEREDVRFIGTGYDAPPPRDPRELERPIAYEGGDWRFFLTHPLRAAHGSVDGRPVLLQVDPSGRAVFSLEGPLDVALADAHEAWNVTRAALGLAPRTLVFEYQRGPVC